MSIAEPAWAKLCTRRAEFFRIVQDSRKESIHLRA